MSYPIVSIKQAERNAWRLLTRAKNAGAAEDVVDKLRAYWAGLYKAVEQYRETGKI